MRKYRVVLTSLLLICLVGVVASQPAAGFLFFGDDDDAYQPPELTPQMQFDITDSEYISLWGRTTQRLEGIDSTEELNEELDEAYSGYIDSPSEKETYLAFFTRGAAIEDRRNAPSQWNRNIGSLDTLGDPPTRGNTTQSKPIIDNAYYQIIQPNPHTIYTTNSEKTKYVGDYVRPSGVLEVEAPARSGSGFSFTGENTAYTITNTEYDFTLTATSDGDTVDEVSVSGSRGGKIGYYARLHNTRLDISSLDHDDPVTFSGKGEITVEETKETYEYVCTNPEPSLWGCSAENTTRNVLDTETFTNTVEVEDSLSGYQKYDPVVDILYSAEQRKGNTDYYYVKAETDEPIEGVKTGSEFIDFETDYVAARDKSFDDEMGEVTPIKHYAIPSNNKATVEPNDEYENFGLHKSSGEHVPTTPSELNDVMLRVDNEDYQTQIQTASGSGETLVGNDFRTSNIEPVSIIPSGSPLETNISEADFTIVPTSLTASVTDPENESYDEDNYRRVDLIVREDMTTPINTTGKEDQYVRVRTIGSGYSNTINTSADGSASFVMPGQPSDTLIFEYIHDFDPDTDDKLYISSSYEHNIETNINYVIVSQNIFTRIIDAFIIYFLPALVLLSLINKGLTGNWYPPSYKRKINPFN